MELRAIIITLLFFAGIISLFLSLYTFKLRSSPLTRSFCLLTAAVAVYAFGYGFELTSATLSDMLFWSKIQYVGISTLPAMVLVMAICYTGQKKWQTARQLMIIFTIPLITLVSRGSNEFHHLFYKTATINSAAPFPMLTFDIGPFYLLHVFYANITLIITTLLFLKFVTRAAPFYRNQAIVMLVATLVQWIGLIVYLFVDIPWNLDINPLLFAVSAPIYAFGIFRFSLLGLVPVARDTVFEGLKDGIIVLDPDNRLVDFNPICQKIFPDISKSHIGSDIRTILGNGYKMDGLLSNASLQEDISVTGENGICYFHSTVSPLLNKKKIAMGTIITFTDITVKKNLMIKLEKMASLDELTNIYNRRYLISLSDIEIAKAKRRNRWISILLIDLDHFKTVNDNFGHLFGDTVLRAFTRIVKEDIRNIDIFGRYGGEEFVIIMPETDPGTAISIAERVRQNVCKNPLIIHDRQISLTVSIGVFGTRKNPGLSFDKLLDFADKALYKAKNMGRNKTVLHE